MGEPDSVTGREVRDDLDPATDRAHDPIEARMRSAERCLDDVPSSALELGRRLEAELDFRARAEVLQALVPCSRLADPRILGAIRRAFGVHVAVVEALRAFWNAAPLRQALPPDGTDPIGALSEERARVEAELFAIAETVGSDERAIVERVRAALIPEVGPLHAAIVLTPQVRRVAAAVFEDRLDQVLSGITPDEYAVVLGSEQPGVEPDRRPDRALVDGVLLRTLMLRDLAEWQRGEGAEREAALRRLADDKLAYRHVAQRLQARCGQFLEEGRRDVAVLGGKIRKSLFAVYLEITRALTGAVEDPAVNDGGTDEDHLRAKIEAAERAAEEVRAERAASREVVEEALDGMARPQATRPEPQPLHDLRAERRRRVAMLAVAGVLAAVAVAVNVVLWQGSSEPPTVPFAAVADALPSAEIIPAGDVVYAEVSSWVWGDMDGPARTEHVERAAQAARASGARAVHVVDESGREVARWTAATGVELAGS